MTVQEAHKAYNSLIDQIRAKYELLDLGECGAVGTPAFNAECSELAHLFVHMRDLCNHLNLSMPKDLHGPQTLSIEGTFQIKISIVAGLVRVWRMQLCYRYVRITRLLSTP